MVRALAAGEVAEARVADVRVDDGDRGAGELGEREAELDEQRRHRDTVVDGDEADDADPLGVEPVRDPGTRGLHVPEGLPGDRDADGGEQRVVVGVRHGGQSSRKAC